MEDTAKSRNVLELAELLDSHRGEETIVLDISGQSSWTDFFVISTISSHAHMKGMLRFIRDFLAEHRIEPFHRRKHLRDEEGWTIVDCGSFIIHLMTGELREFYELEQLWFEGTVLYHSSKSS